MIPTGLGRQKVRDQGLQHLSEAQAYAVLSRFVAIYTHFDFLLERVIGPNVLCPKAYSARASSLVLRVYVDFCHYHTEKK